jgi:hypothetical protein
MVAFVCEPAHYDPRTVSRYVTQVAADVWKLLGVVGEDVICAAERMERSPAWDLEFAHAHVPAWKRTVRARVADMDIYAITRAVLSVLTHTKNPPHLLSILGTCRKHTRDGRVL